MIHGNTTDPVYLKKIALNIWLLRDEIEAVIEDKIKHEGIERDQAITIVQKDYTTNNVVAINSTPSAKQDSELSDNDALDDSENEMAQALEDADALDDKNESTDSEDNEQNEGTENTEDTNDENSEDFNSKIIQLKPKLSPEKIIVGRTILSEIYMDKMFFFSDKIFMEGQSIVLEFQIPKKFIVNAKVTYCRNYNMKSRIIKQNRLLFRTCVEFTFLKKGERTLLRDFLQSIEPKIEHASKKASKKKGNSGADDDIFSELDNL